MASALQERVNIRSLQPLTCCKIELPWQPDRSCCSKALSALTGLQQREVADSVTWQATSTALGLLLFDHHASADADADADAARAQGVRMVRSQAQQLYELKEQSEAVQTHEIMP